MPKGFQKGNQLGKAKIGQVSHNTKQAEELRSYFIQEVIKEREPLIRALIKKGKAGEVQALRDIFDRILGRAKESVDLTSGGKSFIIEIAKEIAEQNDINPSTKTDSK